jgi:REP element-mobilizing transposase RayT
MARPLRFIPDGGSLVEVTTRTLQSRLLLTPSPELNRIVIGTLARASRLHKVGVVAFACLGNHYHLLAWVDDAEQLARFMNLFNSKVAREVARLTDWEDKIWSRRYDGIVVSNEEAAQVARLTYLLGNGCKEDLVAKIEEWPGVHCGPALISGAPLQGVWISHTQEYHARQRGEKLDPQTFEESETLTFVPLPCWEHLSPEQYRRQIAALVQSVEAAAEEQRRKTGKKPLGREAILRQDPTAKPQHTKKSPAPRFHAFRAAVRRDLYGFYAEFVAAFRTAAEKLKSGIRTTAFPIGSFPPHLPFVRA